MIPEEKIAEINERIDLVALVQRHGVELKKSGASFKGRCPFHNEKTPSFYVWPERHFWKCFGCNVGGDAISFVRRLMGKTFLDTVTDLAKEAGVDIERAVDPALKEKAQLKEATDFAAEHFKQRLWDPVVGRKPREYLHSRGVTDDVARQFGLGWAPLEWTGLADKLREQGLLAFGATAGLVTERQSGGFFDMFRGRLMIPIRSPEGRAIAFGGRLLEGDDGPKYLNSKESKLYIKNEILYGLDVAKDEVRRKKSVVLCEGYFDCIGLQQAGVKNAVALCSTALTPGHLAALQRMEGRELVLLLDGDNAGRNAVVRLAGPILAAGAPSRVASLPEGEDPDTWARKVGADAVHELVKTAPSLTKYLFQALLPQGPQSEFEAKMAALDTLKPIAAQIPIGLVRSALFAAMSAHFGLPAAELEVQLRGNKAPPVRAAPKPAGPQEKPPDQWEATWAAAVVRNKALLQADPHHVADEIKHMGVRTLVEKIAAGMAPEDAVYEASEVLKLTIERVQLPGPDNLEQAFLEVCRRLKLRGIEEQLQRITREAAALSMGGELTPESRELLEQQGQLLALKRALMKQSPMGLREPTRL